MNEKMNESMQPTGHALLYKLEGTWISDYGNKRINCQVEDDKFLECIWPNQFVEHFRMDSDMLTGATNPEILGYLRRDGCLVTWSSGNCWTKEGS